MLKLNKTITAIAVCSSLILSVQAYAKPEQGKHRSAMKKVFSQLSISDTQKQDIKQIMQQARGDRDISKPDMKGFKQEFNALVRSESWDAQAVETFLANKQSQKAEAGLRKAQNKHAVWNVLNAEQQAEFVNIMSERKAKAEAGEGKKSRKNKGKSKKGKMAKRLGLDEAQKDQMAAIKSQAKESASELKTSLKSFKQAERALIQSAEFTADAWTNLHQQHQADFLAMAVLKANTKHQMWNVLTAEQQEKAQKMQRHMKSKKAHKGAKKGKNKGQKRNADNV